MTVTVGDTELATTGYTVTAYTSGWGEVWDSGTPLTLYGSEYHLYTDYNAGYYYIGVVVEDTANYIGATLDYSEGGGNGFTVAKRQITLPEFEKELVYDGSAQAPEEIIDVSTDTVNIILTGASDLVVNFKKYDVKYGSSLTGGKPVSYGDYYVVLQIDSSCSDNYEWAPIDDSVQLPNHASSIDKDDTTVINIAFRIAGAQYGIIISNADWTYGGTPAKPVVKAEEGDNDSFEKAIAGGATVTFYYYTSGGTQLLAEVDGVAGAVEGGYITYTVETVPDEVLAAGSYSVRVIVSADKANNYAERSEKADFTVAQYQLQADDIEWTVLSDLTYRGEAFTYDSQGSGSTDIHATYKKWDINGGYKPTTGYLVLTLTGGGEIKDYKQGGYTLTAALPQGEGNIALGFTASKTVEVEKRAVNVTLQEYTVTYKGEEFEAFAAVPGTHYTAEEASGNSGLIPGEELGGTFTPPAQKDVAFYAYDKFAWGNANYSVTVKNSTEQLFVITEKEVTVFISSPEYTYGDFKGTFERAEQLSDDKLTYVITGLIGEDNVTVTATYSTKDGSAAEPKNVGTYTVGATISGNGNYTLASVSTGTLNISARKVTVTVSDEIEYGELASENIGRRCSRSIPPHICRATASASTI